MELAISDSWTSLHLLHFSEGSAVTRAPCYRRAMALRAHDDPVFHLGDAGRRPGGSLGLFTFDPRPHDPFQGDLAAVRFNCDAIRIDLGIASECVLDLALDLRRLGAWLEQNQVAD